MGVLVGVTCPTGALVGVGVVVAEIVDVGVGDKIVVGVTVGIDVGIMVGRGVGDMLTVGVAVGVINVVGEGVVLTPAQAPDPIVTFAGDTWKSTFSVGSSPGAKENTRDLSWSN